MRALAAVLVALALSATPACQTSTREPTAAPARSTATARTACARAWQDFAAIDDFHDRIRAAVPTLRACHSVAEWIEVGETTPGHRLAPTRTTATKMCRYEDGVRSAAVCRSL